MEFVTLNSGYKMPLEGFGVFQIPDLNQCEEVTSNALNRYSANFKLNSARSSISVKSPRAELP